MISEIRDAMLQALGGGEGHLKPRLFTGRVASTNFSVVFQRPKLDSSGSWWEKEDKPQHDSKRISMMQMNQDLYQSHRSGLKR